MEQGLQIDYQFLTAFRQALGFCDLALGQIQIEKFSGYCQDGTETPFSNWLDEFNLMVEPFHLSDEKKAKVLVDNLTGPAREEIVFCLSKEKRRSFKEVVQALRLCFSQEDSHYLQGLFHTRAQLDKEDLADFSRALMRLYAKSIDAADDEATAAALGQLRDEALSSRFVSGARDVRERHILRRLYLKNRGGQFEVLRREALILLHGGHMLEGDELTTEYVDVGTQQVFCEPVQQCDLSSDMTTMEESEEVSALFEIRVPHDASEGGAEIDAGGPGHDGDKWVAAEEELEAGPILEASEGGTTLGPELSYHEVQKYENKQPPGAHVAPRSRSISKGGKTTDNDDIYSFSNCSLEVCTTPDVVWEQDGHVQEVVWGPWESQWRPNYQLICFPDVG